MKWKCGKSSDIKKSKLSDIATQPYSYIATQLHSHRATQPHSYIATKKSTKGGPFGYVATWLCGSVAMQLCSSVAIWLCGYVAMWISSKISFHVFRQILVPYPRFSRNLGRIFIIFRCPPFPNLTFFEVQICKHNMFKDVPIHFVIFFEVFWYNKNHKYGAPGVGKSRNHGTSRI